VFLHPVSGAALGGAGAPRREGIGVRFPIGNPVLAIPPEQEPSLHEFLNLQIEKLREKQRQAAAGLAGVLCRGAASANSRWFRESDTTGSEPRPQCAPRGAGVQRRCRVRIWNSDAYPGVARFARNPRLLAKSRFLGSSLTPALPGERHHLSRRHRCAIGIWRPLPNAFDDPRIVGAAWRRLKLVRVDEAEDSRDELAFEAAGDDGVDLLPSSM